MVMKNTIMSEPFGPAPFDDCIMGIRHKMFIDWIYEIFGMKSSNPLPSPPPDLGEGITPTLALPINREGKEGDRIKGTARCAPMDCECDCDF